jgi:hypothetical protein
MRVQMSRSTSLSDHLVVAAHLVLIHKIGVTGGKVESRHCQRGTDDTYMLTGCFGWEQSPRLNSS